MPLIESTTLAKSNVYVGNLPLNFTTESLMSLFSPFGFILRCKVGVNRTGKNAGYGFVQFDNDESASKAISALDGYSIGENVVHVSVASGRSKRAPRPKTNVYFSGLPHTFATSDLNAMCDRFGRIIGSRVLVNPVTNQSRGYGFVRFDTHENAIKAIASLNGTIPPNGVEPLVVKFAREPTDPQHPSQRKLLRETFQAAEGVSGSPGVWVKSSPGLPLPQQETSDDPLSARFSQIALSPMPSALYRVPEYSYNTYPPSFPLSLYNPVPLPPGTVGLPESSLQFSSPTVIHPITVGKEAKPLVSVPMSSSTTSSTTSSSTTPSASPTTPSSSITQSTVVSVSGFPIKVKKQELDALFSGYGKIISSRYVPNDESTAGLGKGTVKFETHAEALQAASGLNNTTHFGKDPLKVALVRESTSKTTRDPPSKVQISEPKSDSEKVTSSPSPTSPTGLSHYPLPSYVSYPPYQYSPTIQYRYLPTTPPPSGSVFASVPDYKYPVPVTSTVHTPPTNPRSLGTGTYSAYSHGEYPGYQVVDPRAGFPNYSMGFASNPIYVPSTGTTGATGSYYPPSTYQTSASGTVGAITTSMNTASFVSTSVSPSNTTTTKSTSTSTTTTTPYFPSRPISDFYYSAGYR